MPAATRADRLDRPRAAALVALALVALFVGVRLAANGGDPAAFVVAGDRLVDPAAAPAELVVARDSHGYDGQFFYRLALDPLTRERTAYGITLDNPPYRQQRIGLAALTWLVVRLTPLPVSVVLLLVNALALVAAAWLGARLAGRWGRHAMWGLLAGLSPGLLLGLARDLSEPLTWALLLGGISLWLDRRDTWAVVAFSAAVLCRETTLVVLGGMGMWLLVTAARRRDPDALRRAVLLLVPLAVAGAWQWHVYRVWGDVALTAGGGGGTPVIGVFTGLLAGAGDLTPLRDGVLRQLWVLERLWLAAYYVVTARLLPRSGAPGALRAGWVLAAALGLSVAGWQRDMQFLRAANEAIAVGVVVLLATRRRAADVALVSVGAVTAVVGVVHALL